MRTSAELVRIERQNPDLIKVPLWSYREAMFAIYCPTHQSTVLLGPRRIEALRNTPEGVVIEWRCYCGTGGTHSFARRRVAEAA